MKYFIIVVCLLVACGGNYTLQADETDDTFLEECCNDGPISRFFKAHPYLAIACCAIPTIYFLYKWRTQVAAHDDLLKTYDNLLQTQASCVENNQLLEQQLATVQATLAQRENFIKTTFQQVNGIYHLADLIPYLPEQQTTH